MDEITPSGVTAPTDSSVDTGSNPTTGASPTPSGTSSADSSTASTASTGDVQASTTDTDPLSGVPTLDELNQLPDTAQYKKSLIQLRTAYESLNQQHQPLAEKFKVFEPASERFQSPDELQRVLEIHDSILGWQNDESGVPIPATEQGAQKLAELYPLHADYLTADLLDLPTRDPATGNTVPRIDVVLAGMAEDPDQRAKALKILGGVEPGQVAPQWAATPEELEVVKPELQDFYKTLPWEDRDELKALSPEYLNKTLGQMKLTDDLKQERERTQQREQQRQEQREQYVNQQASQAGETYLGEQLKSALTTFHESVVQQSQFLQPLDLQQLPQGMTPEQAQQVNTQVAEANKAEAALISGLVISLFNPQTSAYVIPLLKEIGAVDDKLLTELNNAASVFGSNGRNYGNLRYRGQLQNGNGNGYQPTADVTQLENESRKALQRMVGYANHIRSKLVDQRSRFFELRATQHNETLNTAPLTRPPVNGQAYDPTRSVTQLPRGWQSRAEIEQQYGS